VQDISAVDNTTKDRNRNEVRDTCRRHMKYVNKETNIVSACARRVGDRIILIKLVSREVSACAPQVGLPEKLKENFGSIWMD